MTTWRDRLAAIRARPAALADPAPIAAEAIGAIGANDIGMETPNGGQEAARVAFYARFQAEAAAALAAPDPDLAADRAVMAQHYAAPAAPHLYQLGDPDPLRDGLLLGWRNHRPATP